MNQATVVIKVLNPQIRTPKTTVMHKDRIWAARSSNLTRLTYLNDNGYTRAYLTAR